MGYLTSDVFGKRLLFLIIAEELRLRNLFPKGKSPRLSAGTLNLTMQQ
jgi:hypothetical protein